MIQVTEYLMTKRPLRPLAATATLLAVAAGPTGCTFTDGEPWAEVDGRAAARPIDEPDSGVMPEGVTIDRAKLRVEMFLESVTRTAGGSGGSFDPANPPKGYTLCHTGHCHSEDGELIPYEEVKAEMAAGGGTSTRTLARWKTTVDLTSGEVTTLPRVSIDERTSIDRLKVKATNLILEGSYEEADTAVRLEAQLGQFEVGSLKGLGRTVGPDAEFRQTVDLCVGWSNDWLEKIDLGRLERQDGTIRLTRILNADATRKIVDAVKRARLEASSCGA